jgi:DNA repair exonuclease SbcCD ATPase subunit
VTKESIDKESATLTEQIRKLDEEKSTYRMKAILNWKKGKKLELLLEKSDRERDIANSQLNEVRETLQACKKELQVTIDSKEKASVASAELEEMKRQIASLESQHQQKLSELQAQVKCLVEENSALKQAQNDKNANQQKTLDEALHKVKIKHLAMKKLNKQNNVLAKKNKALKNTLYQQSKLHKIREAKKSIKLESSRKKLVLLKGELVKLREKQPNGKNQQTIGDDVSVEQLCKTIQTKHSDSFRRNVKSISLDRNRQSQDSGFKSLNVENGLESSPDNMKSLICTLRDRKAQNLNSMDVQEVAYNKLGLSMKMLQL